MRTLENIIEDYKTKRISKGLLVSSIRSFIEYLESLHQMIFYLDNQFFIINSFSFPIGHEKNPYVHDFRFQQSVLLSNKKIQNKLHKLEYFVYLYFQPYNEVKIDTQIIIPSGNSFIKYFISEIKDIETWLEYSDSISISYVKPRIDLKENTNFAVKKEKEKSYTFFKYLDMKSEVSKRKFGIQKLKRFQKLELDP